MFKFCKNLTFVTNRTNLLEPPLATASPSLLITLCSRASADAYSAARVILLLESPPAETWLTVLPPAYTFILFGYKS